VPCAHEKESEIRSFTRPALPATYLKKIIREVISESSQVSTNAPVL
jgi:hypothetical protein